MTPEIKTFPETKFVGYRMTMSMAYNKTAELWRSFGPRRSEITNTIGTELYSLQVMPEGYFSNFNPATEFEKWAVVPVTDTENIPNGMETITVPEGLYAVFHYKGLPSEGAKFFQYIFAEWLPQSGYVVDNRPHFEILGEKYSNTSPDSEEDIWIPIRKK